MVTTYDTLSIVSVNAVGDFFRAEIDNKKFKFLTEDEFDNFPTENDSDNELPNRDDSAAKRNPIFRSELFSPFWLLDSPVLSGCSLYKEMSKEETGNWERIFLDPIHRRWSKINFATDITVRNSSAKVNEQNRFEIPEIYNPPEVVRPVKNKGGRPRKHFKLEVVVSTEPSPIPSLPELTSVDESSAGSFGLKILKIFNDDEDLFPEIDASDDEGRKRLKPPSWFDVPRVSESARRSEIVRPIAEVAETMLDFTAGIHRVKIQIFKL